jgi:hypothetical protein
MVYFAEEVFIIKIIFICLSNLFHFKNFLDTMFTYRMSEDFVTEPESHRTNKCMIMDKEIIRDIQPYPDAVVYLEMWGYNTY